MAMLLSLIGAAGLLMLTGATLTANRYARDLSAANALAMSRIEDLRSGPLPVGTAGAPCSSVLPVFVRRGQQHRGPRGRARRLRRPAAVLPLLVHHERRRHHRCPALGHAWPGTTTMGLPRGAPGLGRPGHDPLRLDDAAAKGSLTMNGRSQQGFTIIELLITLVIASLVLAGTLYFSIWQTRAYRDGTETQGMQMSVRLALDRMLRDVRAASRRRRRSARSRSRTRGTRPSSRSRP